MYRQSLSVNLQIYSCHAGLSHAGYKCDSIEECVLHVCINPFRAIKLVMIDMKYIS